MGLYGIDVIDIVFKDLIVGNLFMLNKKIV